MAHLGAVRPGAPHPLKRDIEARQPDRDKGFVDPSMALQRVVDQFRLGLNIEFAPVIAAAGANAVAGQGWQQPRLAPGAKLGQSGFPPGRPHRVQQLAFGGGIQGALFHDRDRKMSPPSYRAGLNAGERPNEKPFILLTMETVSSRRAAARRLAISVLLQKFWHRGTAQTMDLRQACAEQRIQIAMESFGDMS